jgi:hypothetical protein
MCHWRRWRWINGDWWRMLVGECNYASHTIMDFFSSIPELAFSLKHLPETRWSSGGSVDFFWSIPARSGSQKSGNGFPTCWKTEIDRDPFCGALPRGKIGINLADCLNWAIINQYVFWMVNELTNNQYFCWMVNEWVKCQHIFTAISLLGLFSL